MRRTILTRASLAVATGAALILTGTPGRAAPAAPSVSPADRAAANADLAVGAPSAGPALRRADGDTLRRTGVVAGTRGLHYVTYARTHRGLPVVGGDVVVSTDAAGTVSATNAAQSTPISVGTTATVSAAAATATARRQLTTVESTQDAKLVVYAWSATPTLVWETVVTGRTADGTPSVLHVFVDAGTGKVVETVDDVREGAGNGYYYGQVTIATTASGSTFSLTDPQRAGLRCGGQTGTAYSGPDDSWGNGTGTNLETACVDAYYGAQKEVDMLAQWFGRNGIKGDGTTPPLRVGLADVNAYWNGSYANFGRSQDGQRQLTPIDVVAHELGHGLFQHTPGGSGAGNENGGINEATGDIFGALTEAFANNPNDVPDYVVGEEADLVGQGPIRNMYNPSLLGDPNCYSSSIPSTEVHAAAGPLNHWFYLVSEGSNPAGKPASPTCNNSTVSGLGIRKAGEIYYNAMLSKTSTWRHANIRTASLTAAKNLYPNSCAEFDVVKAAWNAISVPAQAGEAACTPGGGTNDFSLAVSPASGSVAAGGSATATVSTSTTAGTAQTVAFTASGLPGGATASFSPASVSSGASSALTITTSAATPAGTYPITITGAGAVSRTAVFTLTVTPVGGGGCTGTNGTVVAIPDGGAAVTSTITVSGCARNAGTASKVAVDITHTYRGDLVIDLVAPDGSAYRLKNSSAFDGADDVRTTYTANLGGEAANGAWRLSVRDVYASDAGRINTWTLTL